MTNYFVQLFGHAMCPQLEKVKREWQSRSEKFLNFHARNKVVFVLLCNSWELCATIMGQPNKFCYDFDFV